MFGFFQFGQPQFGDVPRVSSSVIPVVGLGLMFNGDRRLKEREKARVASINAIELTMLAFLQTQEEDE